MSESEARIVLFFEQLVLKNCLEGTQKNITQWIGKHVIHCSVEPTPGLLAISRGLTNVLMNFIRQKNSQALDALWEAVGWTEFRLDNTVCPTRVPPFRSFVCYFTAKLIIEAEEKSPEAAKGFHRKLGDNLRAAIFEHQYNENPCWAPLLGKLCEKALVCVGIEASDHKLLRVFDVEENPPSHHAVKSQDAGKRNKRPAQKYPAAPIKCCMRHNAHLLELYRVLAQPKETALDQPQPYTMPIDQPRPYTIPFGQPRPYTMPFDQPRLITVPIEQPRPYTIQFDQSRPHSIPSDHLGPCSVSSDQPMELDSGSPSVSFPSQSSDRSSPIIVIDSPPKPKETKSENIETEVALDLRVGKVADASPMDLSLRSLASRQG